MTAHLMYIGSHLSYIRWYRLASNYAATTDALSSTVAYFNGGSSIAAGTYRVYYINGAMKFATTLGWDLAATWYGSPNDQQGQFVKYNGGSNQVFIPTISDGNYTTQALCEAANAGKYVEITHTGGTIGVYCKDYYTPGPGPDGHGDNVSGSPNPTFWLYQLGDSHLAYQP